MAKKMYDVKPPKVAHKIEETIKDFSVQDIKKKHHHKAAVSGISPEGVKTKSHKKNRRFPLRELLVGGGIIIVLLAVYFYFKLPYADIEIWPKLDDVSLQEKITADKSVSQVSLENKTIPAQYVEITKDGSQTFPATGIASNDGKATGKITIYNNLDPASSFSLKSGTHFLSDSGKYFVTLAKVTIPAASHIAGKLVPGSVEVSVQAEQSGSDYNVAASKFSVPKLSGTSYYYNIYAESKAAMLGGYIGKVKKVTADDIGGAKDTLTKSLIEQAKRELKGSLTSDDVLLDGAITNTVISSSSGVKAETVADNFDEHVSIKISALSFKKNDVQEFSKDDINSQLPENKILLQRSLVMDYSADSINLRGGTINLSLDSKAKSYQNVAIGELMDLFSRKTSSQIKDIISRQYGDRISDSKVNFWPFWVKSVPDNRNRVKINLNF